MVGRQAALGGIMMVGARLITRLFDLATLLVLARVLQPKDFGLVALALTLVSIVEMATEMPLNQALVRLPVISAAQYDTAFTLGALRGLFLTVVLAAGALPFAHFYGDPRLARLVWVLSLAPTLRALISPRLAEFQKQLSFWRDFVIELGGKLAGFSVAVGMALLTHDYWAIAAGTVAVPLANIAGSYVLAPYRPRIALAEWRIFSGFVGWISAAQAVSAVNWQFERLLLGRLKTKAQIGLFSAASDLATMPFLALFGPILRPLLAAFASLRDDRARLAGSYQRATSAVVALGLPILVGESLVAEPAIRLVLGPAWIGSALLLKFLSLSTIPALLAMPANPLIMAVGDARLVFKRNLLEISIKLPVAIAGTIMFGFAGIIAARFLSELAAGLFSMVVVRRLVGLPVRQQFIASWRSAASTAVMALAVLAGKEWPGLSGAGDMRALCGAAFIGGTTYCLAMWGFWRLSGRPQGAEAMAVQTLGALWLRMAPRFAPLRRLTGTPGLGEPVNPVDTGL